MNTHGLFPELITQSLHYGSYTRGELSFCINKKLLIPQYCKTLELLFYHVFENVQKMTEEFEPRVLFYSGSLWKLQYIFKSTSLEKKKKRALPTIQLWTYCLNPSSNETSLFLSNFPFLILTISNVRLRSMWYPRFTKTHHPTVPEGSYLSKDWPYKSCQYPIHGPWWPSLPFSATTSKGSSLT